MGTILGPRFEPDNEKSEPVKKRTVITTRKHEVWLIRPLSEGSEEQQKESHERKPETMPRKVLPRQRSDKDAPHGEED